MNSIGTNYQVSFNGLVPKSKYSGTPKLSQQTINYVKKLQTTARETEKEMSDVENQINNQDCLENVRRALEKELEILQEFKNRIICAIQHYKRGENPVFSLNEMRNIKSKQMKELESNLSNNII